MYPITGVPYTLGFAWPFRRPRPGLDAPYWRCRLYLGIENSPRPPPAPHGCTGRPAAIASPLPAYLFDLG